ncbi:MAG TPA: KpsF/GutQ family sugar-phosphate isomerase, partial [Piscirickettsiaceae bacterium]|nr:KpsF/GutQ family sugar-phosphate isomerase [Piscirickettsiaceae bacterium]
MKYQQSAKRVFDIEAAAIANLKTLLNDDFDGAVEAILNSSGRVVICGMGKSGLIGKKIMATLASTGTPSFFMHPGEAFHGDLGMVAPDDIFVAISNSGETEEVIRLLPFLKDNGNTIIAMTGNPASTLAKNADFHLNIAVPQEACPHQLAPTSSTTATLVMGDALAVALMEARNFQPQDFARFHPGGSLGRKLLTKVRHEMKTDNLPL